MQNINKLSELKKGGCALVLDVDLSGDMRRRLQDLGLIRGAEVTCVNKSPLGDPSAFLISGAVIALRHEDSSCIRIRCREV